MLVGIVSTPDTLILNACGVGSAAGVTRAQAAAMYGGAVCGWDSPMADPKNYDEVGFYIGPATEVKDGD